MSAKVNPKFGFALALFILAGIAGLATYRLRESGKAAWWAEVSLLLRDELNTALILLERSQSAVRGYALTGQKQFLAPYQAATNDLTRCVKTLQWYANASRDPKYPGAVATIQSLMYERLADLEVVIRLVQSEGPTAAQKYIAQGTGENLQKEYGEFISNFRRDHILVQKANIKSDRSSRLVALIVVLAGSVVSFLLVLFSFILLQHKTRQRDLAEAAARENKERLQMTLRGVRAGVWHVQIEPRVLFWSPEFRELYGFSPDEPATDERWRSSVHPDDLPRVEQEIKSIVRGGMEEWQTEYRITHPNRSDRWVLALTRVWRDAEGRPERLGGINLDITERKLVELQLAQTKRLLQEHTDHLEKTVHERTAKLQHTITELESFSYTVSHDLRSPLRAMHSCAELVLQDYGTNLELEGQALLGRIIQAAKRMDALTRELLNYSQITRSEIRCDPMNLEVLLAEVIELNPALKAPGVELVMETPFEKCLGHESLLRHCLANLLDNAVKFVPPGVSPRVRIRTERRAASSAGGSPRSEEFVCLWVEDNGIGIDPRFHRRIFNIFERLLEHPSEGTGVGLAIVAKAVARMGGRCGCESAAGQGSRFWIELRAPDDPRLSKGPADRLSRPANFRQISANNDFSP